MKTLFKILTAVFSIVVLANCASKVSSPETTDAAAQSTADSYDTINGTDTYAYGQQGRVGGQIVGGPTASATERTIYFEFDSAEIRSDAQPVIEAHARYLLDNPAAAIILEGHADERGTREYNVGLGELRSEAVRRVMSAYGVDLQQIRVLSYGEERPAALGQEEASYALNRRVEIVY